VLASRPPVFTDSTTSNDKWTGDRITDIEALHQHQHCSPPWKKGNYEPEQSEDFIQGTRFFRPVYTC